MMKQEIRDLYKYMKEVYENLHCSSWRIMISNMFRIFAWLGAKLTSSKTK